MPAAGHAGRRLIGGPHATAMDARVGVVRRRGRRGRRGRASRPAAATSRACAAAASSPTLPGAPGCPMFPPDNPWNQRVDRLPVATNSAQLIAGIGLDDPVHPDFGTVYDGAPNGIPYAVVSNRTRGVPVRFQYASESDGHDYPLPPNVPIEGGPKSSGDRHVIVVNRDTCTDYELYAAYPHAGGTRWTAGSGAIFNLRSDELRPAGWTSADAAGLPILPGLAIYGEVAPGRSTTRCGSPRRAPGITTSTRPATTPPAAPAPTHRRWDCGCG